VTIDANGASAFDDILRRVMRQPLEQTWGRVAEAFDQRDQAIDEVVTGVHDLGIRIGRLSADLIDERRITIARDGAIGETRDRVAALRNQVDALQGSVSGARAEIRGVRQTLNELRRQDDTTATLRRLVVGLIVLTVIQLIAITALAALVATR
jgi:hypothetical protein